MILTVGDNLIEINTTRTRGSKSACYSQISEMFCCMLETLDVSHTRGGAMTLVRKVESNSFLTVRSFPMFEKEAPSHLSLTR